jgi:hypothetical protein
MFAILFLMFAFTTTSFGFQYYLLWFELKTAPQFLLTGEAPEPSRISVTQIAFQGLYALNVSLIAFRSPWLFLSTAHRFSWVIW